MIKRLLGMLLGLSVTDAIANAENQKPVTQNTPEGIEKLEQFYKADWLPEEQFPKTANLKYFPHNELIEINKQGKSTLAKHYQPLNRDEIEKMITNSTIYGLTFKKQPYALYFSKDHKAIVKMEDGRTEVGKWYVDDKHHIYSQWPTISDNKLHKVRYLIYEDKSHIIKLSPTTGHYSVFVVKAGDPEQVQEHIPQTQI